jgi:transposase
MARRKEQSPRKIVDFDVLQQINEHAAGVDLGAEEIWVAVPHSRDTEAVRKFGTWTAELRNIAAWLKRCGVQTVAMESTGIYWVPLYEMLERQGFEVYLVNARHIKNVSGRKTDVLDCQWIQQLHTYGLLQRSFRPPEHICAIRALVRQREMLIHSRAAHIQHMQKALLLMNVQLTMVLSDITGITGMQIIRAIVSGERDPHVLASFRNAKCAKSEEQIAQALDGHYRPEQLFALQQAVELYDFYGRQLQACDAELEKLYAQCEPSPPVEELSSRGKQQRRKNQPYFDLRRQLFQMTGVDLTAVDGLDALTVQTIVSEVGVDMHPWPTHKHFGAWLGLAPRNQTSGGKVKRRDTARNSSRAATAFRVAAQSLARSDTALGAFYRRIRAKHGAPKAITATAYKLARIVYHMLKERTPYRVQDVSYYETQYRERTLRNLRTRAARLGYRLEPEPTDNVPVSGAVA